MDVPDPLRERVGAGRWTPVAGGDIADAWRVDRSDGGRCFVKHLAGAPPGFFAAEAAGLRFLAEPAAIAVPQVIDHSDEPGEGFLALEWIDPGRRAPSSDESLGRGLAALHAAGPDHFGGDGSPAFIGSVPVDSTPVPTWAALWSERRLDPLTRRAVDSGRLPVHLANRLDRVITRIDELAGPPEPPSRVHGDLWAGNVLVDTSGNPWLIDPAAHGGHRETDLAMMRLFGGFGDRTFAAYRELAPLAEGWQARVPLHQLVPLLVHVILFGGGYVGSLSRALDDLVG